MEKTDQKKKVDRLTELQVEAKEKETVVFRLYASLLAFSGAALLALATVPPHGDLTIFAGCMLITACMSFGVIVVGRVFVLHKAGGLHIGHIIVAEKFSDPAHVVGLVSLTAGITLFVWHISYVCALFFLVSLGLAFGWHVRFKKALDKMPDARHALGVAEGIQPGLRQDSH